MRFQSPWAFLLFALLPLVAYLAVRLNRPGSIRFPTTAGAFRSGISLRQRFRFLPLAIRLAALSLMIVALARPQFGKEEVKEHTRGIAIEMVVDRSGTMGLEMSYGKKQVTRLDVVKDVFKDFVAGDKKGLKGRQNDLVGMVAFARYPDTLCPLTLSHGALFEFLANVQVVKRQEEDGTSIGDAIALAAARLKTAEENLLPKSGGRPSYEIKSKIMILLTDGQNNAGNRSPLDAAALAKQWGIKIYTIGVGSKEAVATVQTPLGPYKMLVGPGLDEETLKTIAENTGGMYRSADTADALRAVCQEIDKMEKSEIASSRFLDYSENFAYWAMGALALLLAEAVISSTWLRRIP